MEEGLSIIIAEDNEHQRARLHLYAQKSGLTILESVSSGTRLIEECLKHRPDLVLLDIGLERMDGISAYKNLLDLGIHLHIIFITGSSNPTHLLMGYELDSIDYLTKPLNYSRFEVAINKAKKKIQYEKYVINIELQSVNMVTVKSKRRNFTVSEDQIICAEKEGDSKVIRLYTVNSGVVETTTPLNKIADQCSTNIFSPHRSFLVNLKYIEKVVPDNIITGNHIIKMKHVDMNIILTKANYEEYMLRTKSINNWKRDA
ncbi:LytR/AlgR family response regulator transcription factor [Paenibacillus gansuensis]|uniref:LytR/AlgR family response regulator transcription factor n=1 Tax=Paenibacillus gansuensis TaxID=306542 RepID=A0ABW5PJC6_9BACL